jgi:predicted DCC family thiol-disulfide oxidoreductase YuxK
MRDNARELVLFDGVCNLCERSVLFIVRHDSAGHFQFCSLQSRAARTILDEHEYNDDTLGSVLLLSKGELYTRSRAALHIAKRLDGLWPLFFYMLIWVPPVVADPVYNFVGKRRYKWFGKKDACWVPDTELRQRFIDS